jgi:hypothetical protein
MNLDGCLPTCAPSPSVDYLLLGAWHPHKVEPTLVQAKSQRLHGSRPSCHELNLRLLENTPSESGYGRTPSSPLFRRGQESGSFPSTTSSSTTEVSHGRLYWAALLRQPGDVLPSDILRVGAQLMMLTVGVGKVNWAEVSNGFGCRDPAAIPNLDLVGVELLVVVLKGGTCIFDSRVQASHCRPEPSSCVLVGRIPDRDLYHLIVGPVNRDNREGRNPPAAAPVARPIHHELRHRMANPTLSLELCRLTRLRTVNRRSRRHSSCASGRQRSGPPFLCRS